MLVARSSSLRCWSLHSRGVFKPWRGRERMRGTQCESAPCKPVRSDGQDGCPQRQGPAFLSVCSPLLLAGRLGPAGPSVCQQQCS